MKISKSNLQQLIRTSINLIIQERVGITLSNPQSDEIRSLAANKKKILNMLLSPDIENVKQGLFLLEALNDQRMINVLASRVKIEDGEVEVSKLLSGRRSDRNFDHIEDTFEKYRMTRAADDALVYAGLGLLKLSGKLKNVSYLSLNEKVFEDIDVLEGASGLQTLHLAACSMLKNVDGLQGCENIQKLNLNFCESLQDITNIADCKKLKTLYMRSCRSIENLLGLRGCTELKRLELSENNIIQDLSGLENCNNLDLIEIANCDRIQNIDSLQNISSLRYVNFNNCESLQNVDGLINCGIIRKINLDNCASLQNLDGLKNANKLLSISIMGCRSLQSIEGLRGNPRLENIDMGGCASVQNLDSVLQDIPNLRSVILPDGSRKIIYPY